MYTYRESNNKRTISIIIIIGLVIYLYFYLQNQKKEEVENLPSYKWTILNKFLFFSYADITSSDRIEAIRTNGEAGHLKIISQSWIPLPLGKIRHNLLSITGFYDSDGNDTKIYATLINTESHMHIGSQFSGTWQPMSGNFYIISAGNDGHAVGIGLDTNIWYHARNRTRWERTYHGGPDFSSINTSKYRVICGVKKDGTIYKLDGLTMVEIPNNGIKFKQASIGVDESIFAIDKNNNLYKLDEKWINLNKKAKMVTHYNENKFYIINMNNNLEEGKQL